jgi:hypothetical protein
MEEPSRRILTVQYMVQNKKSIPIIRLQGKWLLKRGFACGSIIEVEENDERLLITVLKDQQSEFG